MRQLILCVYLLMFCASLRCFAEESDTIYKETHATYVLYETRLAYDDRSFYTYERKSADACSECDSDENHEDKEIVYLDRDPDFGVKDVFLNYIVNMFNEKMWMEITDIKIETAVFTFVADDSGKIVRCSISFLSHSNMVNRDAIFSVLRGVAQKFLINNDKAIGPHGEKIYGYSYFFTRFEIWSELANSNFCENRHFFPLWHHDFVGDIREMNLSADSCMTCVGDMRNGGVYYYSGQNEPVRSSAPAYWRRRHPELYGFVADASALNVCDSIREFVLSRLDKRRLRRILASERSNLPVVVTLDSIGGIAKILIGVSVGRPEKDRDVFLPILQDIRKRFAFRNSPLYALSHEGYFFPSAPSFYFQITSSDIKKALGEPENAKKKKRR